MEVFKTYLGLFHPDLTTAAQLTTLKNVLYGKEVAVETGGLRLGDALSCGDMMGENTWYSEYYGWVQPRLKRWIDIGGQITYITADHAFFYT